MFIKTRIAAGLVAATATGAVLVAGAMPVQAAPAGPARTAAVGCCMQRHLEAHLRGHGAYRQARGHADYQSSWRRHLDVSLWNARRLAGRTVFVYVRGTRAGSMHIWRGGSGHFSRGRGIPRCTAGTVISIRTKAGMLVASGTFRRHSWMMRTGPAGPPVPNQATRP